MRKLKTATIIGVIIGLAMLVAAPLAMAEQGSIGSRKFVTETVTGAAGGDGTLTLNIGADHSALVGRYLQKFITNPGDGAAAPDAYTGTTTDTSGQSLTIAERSTADTEEIDIPATNGKNWIASSTVTITFTGMGEGNTVEVTLIGN